jgi:hypothetical protein
MIVDRFHYCTHSQHDQFCKNSACPELPENNVYLPADDPRVDKRLWRHTGRIWEFMWQSSMAETTNSWAVGLKAMLKTTSAVMHNFIFNAACVSRNELLLREMRTSKRGSAAPFFAS